jgi:hypothetical protein
LQAGDSAAIRSATSGGRDAGVESGESFKYAADCSAKRADTAHWTGYVWAELGFAECFDAMTWGICQAASHAEMHHLPQAVV